MKPRIKPTEPDIPNEVEELCVVIKSAGGTKDDDDNRDDEHAGENEIPVRETDEETEAPEEFEVDDEVELGSGDDDDPDDLLAAAGSFDPRADDPSPFVGRACDRAGGLGDQVFVAGVTGRRPDVRDRQREPQILNRVARARSFVIAQT